MFKIGDFSRLTQVTVKALRHYDRLGLLHPAQTDPMTGYRYYTSAQLPRLNRILALKELGFSLEEIGQLLDDELSPDELRGMLLLKQREASRAVEAEQARLARIEAHLHLIEQSEGAADETNPADLGVVVKPVEARHVASVRAVLPAHRAIGELFRELRAYQQRHRLQASDWVAIWHDAEYRDSGIDGEATFASSDPLPAEGRVQPRELEAVATMASVVHQGPPETIHVACMSLLRWIEAHGYQIVGPERAIALQRSGLGPHGRDGITELQFPIDTGASD